MRKLICFISAIVMAASVMCIPAQAADLSVIAIYDDEGTLVYSTNSQYIFDGLTDNSCIHRFVIPDKYSGMREKYYDNCENAVYQTWYGEEADAPWNTAESQPTEAPASEAPTAAPAPVKTPYPAVYEKALDAVNAPAVVMEVNETLINGETWYDTAMLYQGVEINTKIYEDAVIESAPPVNENLIGSNTSALKKGDVIHFTCDLQGRVKSIEFIFRPTCEDYAQSGRTAADLVGSDRYSTFHFGVPIKTAKGYMELLGLDGKITEIDLHTGTFIYGDTIGRRSGTVELLGTGYSSVMPTKLPHDTFSSWEDISPTAYVLVRARNGTATEIIQFEN